MKWQWILVIVVLFAVLVLGCTGGKKDAGQNEISTEGSELVPDMTEETDTSTVAAPELTEDDIDLGEII